MTTETLVRALCTGARGDLVRGPGCARALGLAKREYLELNIRGERVRFLVEAARYKRAETPYDTPLDLIGFV